jgi:hypothetical protein
MRRHVGWLVAPILAGLGCLILVATSARGMARAERSTWPSKEQRVVVPPVSAARVFSLGYGELCADIAWAYTLVYYGDGLVKRTSLLDVEALLRLVNTLDPHFRRPYVWGGYATTYRQAVPTQTEFQESVRILERGITALPDDWELLWLLGLRYYLDLKSNEPSVARQYLERGATLIERAMRAPDAPSTLPILASTIRTKLGQRDRALRELGEMILHTEDPATRQVLKERYAVLASKDATDELTSAAEAFQKEWKDALPFAPPSLYILIGKRPPRAWNPSDAILGDRVELLPE